MSKWRLNGLKQLKLIVDKNLLTVNYPYKDLKSPEFKKLQEEAEKIKSFLECSLQKRYEFVTAKFFSKFNLSVQIPNFPFSNASCNAYLAKKQEERNNFQEERNKIQGLRQDLATSGSLKDGPINPS